MRLRSSSSQSLSVGAQPESSAGRVPDEEPHLGAGGEWLFYCESRPKPKLRGVLHAFCAATSPLWVFYQLSLCHGTEAVMAALFPLLSAVGLFSASGMYHRYRCKSRGGELLLGKFDYIGIFLQVAFSIAPFYVLLLPGSTGRVVILLLFCSVLAGAPPSNGPSMDN